jgi:hypothetical protein
MIWMSAGGILLYTSPQHKRGWDQRRIDSPTQSAKPEILRQRLLLGATRRLGLELGGVATVQVGNTDGVTQRHLWAYARGSLVPHWVRSWENDFRWMEPQQRQYSEVH